MARVVARRSGPPYLLILFVFLFVAAAGLAVLAYSEMDKVNQELTTSQEQIKTLQDEKGQLAVQVDDLAFQITGKTGSLASEARQAADEAYLTPDYKVLETDGVMTGRGGVASDLKSLAQLLVSARRTLAGRQQQLDTATETSTAKDTALQAQVDQAKAEIAKLNAQADALRKDIEAKQAEMTTSITKSDGELKNQRAELQKEINAREDRIQKLMEELTNQAGIVAKQKDIIRQLQGGRGPARPDMEPDGEIVRLTKDTDICYINIGSESGVKPGMTFVVSPKGSQIEIKRVNEEDVVLNVKGRIRVITPRKGFSECIITDQSLASPIIPGDNVTNVAYRAARNYTFVVKGLFDLYNTGNPTHAGREEVIQAIDKFGGKVVDNIDYLTDYIVLGEEPEKPAVPDPSATPSVHEAYKKQLQRYKEYQDVLAKAQANRIPILSTNRFLIFTGYMPERKPQ